MHRPFAIAALLASLAPLAHPGANELVTVATLEDAGIVSIGTYNGREWLKWTPPGGPPVREWTIVYRDGTRGSLRERPQSASAAEDRMEGPRGVAVAGPASIHHMRELSDDERSPVVRAISQRVVEAELASIAASPIDVERAVERPSRQRLEQTAIAVETLVESPRDARGGVWLHLVGEKRYPSGVDSIGATPLTRLEALLYRHADGRLAVVDVGAYVTDTSAVWVSRHPEAVIQIGDSAVWAVREQYEDGTDYTLLQPTMRGLGTVAWEGTAFVGIGEEAGEIMPISVLAEGEWATEVEPEGSVPARLRFVPLGGKDRRQLAVSGIDQVERFAPIPETERRAILDSAAGDILRAEEQAASTWTLGNKGLGFEHPGNSPERRTTPLTVHTAVRSVQPINGFTYTYVEATKRYARELPVTGGHLCPAVTRIGITVRERRGGQGRQVDAYTDGECVVRGAYTPIALFAHGDDVLWVTRREGEPSTRAHVLVVVRNGIPDLRWYRAVNY